MTRPTTDSKSGPYNANGATTSWDYDFKIWDSAHLEVTVTDADGVEEIIDAADYTVTGAGEANGGSVTYPVLLPEPDTLDPLASGYKLTIRHKPPLSQGVGFRNTGGVTPANAEMAMDKLSAQIQYLDEMAQRSVKVPISSSTEPEEYLSTLEGYVDDASASATAAASSASAAASSASAASSSASSASTSASNASTSATNAASSASSASSSASNASTSASDAASSATAASTSATTATTQASNAATSATGASTSASNAATSATNASTSASSASTSASAASTSASNAASSESNASSSATAAAASAAKLSGTSTSSVAIATGSKSFTTQASKFFDAGSWVLVTSDADPTNYMHGQVTSYSGTSLTVNVTNIGGSGTLADWTIRVSGTRGATGATGPAGAKGLTWQGAYDNGTAYAVDDAVSYNGRSYINIQAGTGHLPTDVSYWELLAEKGADGAGAGDMLASTYDPANIAQQLVGTTATQTLTNKTLTSVVLDTGVSGTAVLDEDNMSSNSSTKLATQQSIKAYVDTSTDITGLTADSSPDPSADYLTSYDASASGKKKVLHKNVKPIHCLAIAASDETTALTTGTAKVTWRMPYAFTLTEIPRISVTTAPTGSVLTVDVNEAGSSILSTKLTIDASEKTSTTAATPAVLSDSSLADDAEMTLDIDGVGSTIAGAGLKLYLIGHRT